MGAIAFYLSIAMSDHYSFRRRDFAKNLLILYCGLGKIFVRKSLEHRRFAPMLMSH